MAFAVSCKSTGPLFKPSDSTYADTDQNKLKWEYKQRERQLKKHNRRAARLAKTRVNRDIHKVIQTARTYRGTPYRYGGTTRIGMDCSGLLCTSFKAIDVNLPRTSNEQSQFGEKVRTKEIRPGDLVFFSESPFSSRISHVGMVTEVKGPEEVFFIHASTSLGVMEDNLFSNYYQKIFLKAVRPKI
jgi:cell wall-associated NlpC family hydrolase